jgi:hypothetical protein
MIVDYYRSLFTIACRHDFYEDGICPDLAIEPTAECQQVLYRHRLWWRGRENGIVIISENQRTETGDLAPRISVSDNTRFNFVLKLKNPYFLNISQVNQNFIQSKSVFVFTASETATQAEDGTVTIHDGALSNGVIPDNLMQVVSKVFQLPIDQSLNTVRVAIENEIAEVLFSVYPQASNTSVTIDLQSFSEGIYLLRSFDATGEEVAFTRVFSSESSTTSGLFGFVQIPYVASLVEPIYLLNFASRQINWLYQIRVGEIAIAHPDNLDLNNIELSSIPVSFNRQVDAVARIVSFVSDTRIPLRQQPYRGIELSYVSDGGTEILIPNMPNPNISRLRQDETSEADLTAQMSLTIK